MRPLKAGTMQLIVTSPPYNIGKAYARRHPPDAYVRQQAQVISECARLLAGRGCMRRGRGRCRRARWTGPSTTRRCRMAGRLEDRDPLFPSERPRVPAGPGAAALARDRRGDCHRHRPVPPPPGPPARPAAGSFPPRHPRRQKRPLSTPRSRQGASPRSQERLRRSPHRKASRSTAAPSARCQRPRARMIRAGSQSSMVCTAA